MSADWLKQLDSLYLKGQVLLAEPLRRYTSMGVGGPAQALVFPSDTDDLTRLLQFAREQAVPFFILGAGSNLLVRDGGFNGLVINLCLGFKQISHRSRLLCAQAGVLISKLLAYAQTNQLAGMEFLAGVPGTVGGAVVMNAGAAGKEIGELVRSVSLLRPEGNQLRLQREQIEFGYRTTSLASQGIVLEAEFELLEAASETIENKVQQVLAQRKQTQPPDPSAGSIFKNPPGDYAGRLIEGVGLKGFSLGNAQVSERHANFILNKGGASAQDIESLIQLIQKKVLAQKGIRLEPEVKIVGQAKEASA